jgi:copper chaperone CopZ
VRDRVDALATSILTIEGADLPGQADRLRNALKGMPGIRGIRGIQINYLLDTAKARYDPNKLSLARIKAAMK